MNSIHDWAEREWAVDPAWVSTLMARVAETRGRVPRDEQARAQETFAAALDGATLRCGSELVIMVRGALIDQPSARDHYHGASALGYRGVRRALAEAALDDAVESVVLRLDTPGGQVIGCAATAQAIIEFPKPIIAEAQMACSAGMWLAAACDEIVASPEAAIGCVGVQMGVWSDTKAAEIGGLCASPMVLVTSAQTPEKNIDPVENIDQYQSRMDGLWAIFAAALANSRDRDRPGGKHRPGRGDASPETVAADFGAGAVVLGGRALEMGIVDRVEDLVTRWTASPQAAQVREGDPKELPAADAAQPAADAAQPAADDTAAPEVRMHTQDAAEARQSTNPDPVDTGAADAAVAAELAQLEAEAAAVGAEVAGPDPEDPNAVFDATWPDVAEALLAPVPPGLRTDILVRAATVQAKIETAQAMAERGAAAGSRPATFAAAFAGKPDHVCRPFEAAMAAAPVPAGAYGRPRVAEGSTQISGNPVDDALAARRAFNGDWASFMRAQPEHARVLIAVAKNRNRKGAR